MHTYLKVNGIILHPYFHRNYVEEKVAVVHIKRTYISTVGII